ncbi:hypothetical protein D9M70_456790 [compost metagenome]
MPFVHRKDNGLAPIGRTPDSVSAGVALLQHVPKFANHGAISLGDRKLALQGIRIDGYRMAKAKQFVQLSPRFIA